MNAQHQLAESKRLRALLRLAEANLETTAARSGAPVPGLPRRMFHTLGIHDDVLDALVEDGFVERGGSGKFGASGRRPRGYSRDPGSRQDSNLVLTPPATALLDFWLARGASFALPTSLHGLQPPAQTHPPRGGEEAPYPFGPPASDILAELGLPGILAPHNTPLVVRRPTWDRRAGDLCWRDKSVLHLTDHASVEADVLDEFQRLGWIWVIRDPIEHASLGDPTQSRRHAVLRLNQNQAENHAIHFGSLHGGHICWCPAEWVAEAGFGTIVPLV